MPRAFARPELRRRLSTLLTPVKPVKWWLQRKWSNLLLRQQLAWISENHPDSSLPCPICAALDCKLVVFYSEKCHIEKAFCPHCIHIFSHLGLPDNPDKVRQLFVFSEPSRTCDIERKLILRLVSLARRGSTQFLNFGTGGNFAALDSARNKVKLPIQIWGCDLVMSREDRYFFKTYSDDTMLGRFDAICSSETIEHLDDTVTAWIYMNRLLKPKREGEGSCFTGFPR